MDAVLIVNVRIYRENFAVVCDGADQFRRFSREMIRESVDVLKINVSGDSEVRSAPAETTVMTDAEVAAVCEVARAHDKRTAAHARRAESVKMALRHGVEAIYHATLLDVKEKDQLQAHMARVFVAPVISTQRSTKPRHGGRPLSQAASEGWSASSSRVSRT